jgi:hypothetical protein
MFHLNFLGGGCPKLPQDPVSPRRNLLLASLSLLSAEKRTATVQVCTCVQRNQSNQLTVPVLAVGGLHLYRMMHLQQTEYHELSVSTGWCIRREVMGRRGIPSTLHPIADSLI